MRIRTQFIVNMLLFGAILAAISASAIITNQMMGRAHEQEDVAQNIAQGASQLSYLANDYVIYRESQQLERWQTRFASFSEDVARLQAQNPEQQALIRNIQANAQRLSEVFNSVVSTISSPSGSAGGDIDPALLRVSWSRIAVQSQTLTSDASQLSHLFDNEENYLHTMNSLVIITLIGVLIAYFLANYLITQKRVLEGLTKIQAGATIVGSGNLDFRIEEKRDDEIGDLSRAFNRMSTNLKDITTTRSELEKEIDERKRIQSELEIVSTQRQLALDAARMGWWHYNPITGISQWDERYKEIFQVTEYAKPTDEILATRLHPEDLPGVWASVEAAMDPANPQSYSAEYRIILPDGSIRWIEAHGIATFDGRGKKRHATSLVGTVADITERRKLDQMKDDFIGMVSHELKTPITVVIGGIYTAMTKGISQQEAQELLQNAASSADSLAIIVDNFLELSRAKANRLMINKELIDIAEFMQETTRKLKGKSAIHRLVLNVPKKLPEISADRMRLERILENLIDNAIKYSPKGGDVTISVQQKDDCLLVGVKDQGIGISAEDQSRLFRQFERLETTKEIAGVGLGLNVCHRLVEVHGGRIWVKSEPDKGSTFLFTLPLTTC